MNILNPLRLSIVRSLLLAPRAAEASPSFRLALEKTAPSSKKPKDTPPSPTSADSKSVPTPIPNPKDDNSELARFSKSRPKPKPQDELGDLDPLMRQLACVCPPAPVPPAAVDDASLQRFDRVRVTTMDELFNTLVRRVGWSLSNDRRSGALCIEIAAGELEGSTLLISAGPQELRIELDAPPGVDVEVWKNRLSRRLASHGLRASLF